MTLQKGENVFFAEAEQTSSESIKISLDKPSSWDGLWRGIINVVQVLDGEKRTSDQEIRFELTQNGDELFMKVGANAIYSLKIDPQSLKTAVGTKKDKFPETSTSRGCGGTTIDVVLPTDSGHEIRTSCVTRPTEHQKILLGMLGFRLPARIRTREMV